MLINAAAQVRVVILEILSELSKSTAVCYLIKGSHCHGFSLCQQFGMIEQDYEGILVATNLAMLDSTSTFKLKPKEWETCIYSGDFIFSSPKMPFHFDQKIFNLDVHVDDCGDKKHAE